MKVEEFGERILEVAGWEVRLTTYKLDGLYHCKADNVSPGAALARASAATRGEAEARAIDRAGELLSGTRRLEV